MKYVKLFEEYITNISENITITPRYAGMYFDGIKKRLGAKKINLKQINDLTAVDFDDKLRLFVKGNEIIGYNVDMSDDVFELGKTIKSFSDIEMNLKLFGKTGKPISNPNQVKNTVSITEELPKGVKELKDGLTIEEINKKFKWLLKADFTGAVIGKSNVTKNTIVWYEGTWNDGIWVDGYWAKGIFNNGTWKDGQWNGGTFNGGTWEDGYWFDGTFINSIWKDGHWRTGTWINGTWEEGRWEYGVWKSGKWLDQSKPEPNNR